MLNSGGPADSGRGRHLPPRAQPSPSSPLQAGPKDKGLQQEGGPRVGLVHFAENDRNTT